MPIIFPTKQIIKSLGIVPSKKHSQNFLIDRGCAERAVSCAGLTPEDVAIEIGPGPGSLTFFLERTGATVICYEIDRRLFSILERQLEPGDQVFLKFQDILAADFAENTGGRPAVLFGSIPYAITSPIIIKALENISGLKRAVFILQKEVADRLIAEPGCKEYGILTVYCRAYFQAAVRMHIPAECFYPAPKVDSAVIELAPRQGAHWHGSDEELFRIVVRTGFSQRRKTILNCLKGFIGQRGIGMDILLHHAEKEHLNLTRRAETFTVPEFYRLAHVISQLSG